MSSKDHLRYNHLTKAQISNPHLFLEYFCRCDIDIEALRIEFFHMIRSACSSKKHGNPEDYFHYHRCLLQFLEVGHIFFRRGKKFSIAANLTLSTKRNINQLIAKLKTKQDEHWKKISRIRELRGMKQATMAIALNDLLQTWGVRFHSHLEAL